MNHVFFFQTQQIHDNTNLFDQLKKQNIFYSYFQVHQNYYFFVYAQQSIQLDLIYESIDVIQELDSKQRKIRSFRGFFLYGLEIMQMGENYEILKTNLQPFFWRKVKNIIQQNQKGALLEFLFGKDKNHKSVHQSSSPHLQEMQDKIQNLHNQVDSLQQKVIHLETLLKNSKYALKATLDQPDEIKIIQQDDSTIDSNKGSYLAQNDTQINTSLKQIHQPILKSVSEASKSPLTQLSESQQYNIPSNQEKGLNENNFITLGKISEDEKIEIIKLGFQLQAQGKISLKKYYETTDPNSLFQLKGYNIKYETIRRTKLYQSLKE